MSPARSEEALVAWLRRLTAQQHGRPRRGGPRRPSRPLTRIGDDTATLPGGQVVTVDQQIEGIHFPIGLPEETVARRLLAVNLSDLAASGARPQHAFLALAAPPGFDHRAFFRALAAACADHSVELAGGDLAVAPRLHAALTLIGRRRKGDATLARDLARAGQRLWVGGTLGESALGCELLRRGARLRGGKRTLPEELALRGELQSAALQAIERHLLPTPQLALGRWLAARGVRTAVAAIDLSDGLAKDLHRLCDASGVGARLDPAALAAAASPRLAELAARLGVRPECWVESGGEDYVLLFTLPQGIAPPVRFGTVAIGEITAAPGILVDAPEGAPSKSRRRLARAGWDHLARRPPSTPSPPSSPSTVVARRGSRRSTSESPRKLSDTTA